MARPLRIEYANAWYHILNRGRRGEPIFADTYDYIRFIDLLQDTSEQWNLRVAAYCLMPNHFHLVVKACKGEALSQGMQWFTTTHVRRHHRLRRSSGHVWQGRYKSFAIEGDTHFLTVARYVEGNPVRARLVDTAMDWVWSSHRDRVNLLTGTASGTGSKGACPHNKRNLTTCSHGKRIETFLAPLPVSFDEDWTEFVNTPLTAKELGQVKKRVDRQTKDRSRDGDWTGTGSESACPHDPAVKGTGSVGAIL